MAVRYSTAVRNARLNALATVIGTTPKLRFYTGTAPASCAAAATGTLLAELDLPSSYLSSASGGVASQVGAWETADADASGTPGYFRVYDSAGTTCHWQGVCPDDLLGSPTEEIVIGAQVVITGYTITEGNA